MLRYENKKTGSVLNIPEDIKIKDVNDYSYLIRMMIYNDERIIKKQVIKLTNSLRNIILDRINNNDK